MHNWLIKLGRVMWFAFYDRPAYNIEVYFRIGLAGFAITCVCLTILAVMGLCELIKIIENRKEKR